MNTRIWLLMSFLAGSCLVAPAQRADGIYHIACMVQMKDTGGGKQTAECTTHPREYAEIAIGSKVSFDVTTTQELMDEEGAPEVTDLILFLDGQPLPGTHPVVESQTDEPLSSGSGEAEEKNQEPDSVVTFRLTFPVTRDLSSETGRASWKKLLAGMGKERKRMPVSMGLLNGPPLPSTYKVGVVRLGGTRLAIFVVLAAALGFGFFLVASRTGALRDKEPPPKDMSVEPTKRAYSLSRMQIAIWTLLVVYAYLFIWLITGDYNTEIPRTILAILGISAGTYATAAAIDKEKERGAGGRGATVAETESLFSDLLTGDAGASLHRAQFGLWSVVLMIVFIVTVYDTLAMPQFDASLLALMGISAAAYAGMKIPEKKQ